MTGSVFNDLTLGWTLPPSRAKVAMIPLHKVFIPHDIKPLMADLERVIASGWVGEGPQVAAFEAALAPIVGSPRVTAVNSCTSALTLALRLAGVGPGDEVITTPLTCMATNLPILLAGATPVWADVDMTTGNISPRSVEQRITARTKAIMMVHWGGNPCDIAGIAQLASYTGIKVIEDAAHALGASYCGAPIGSHSDYVCFSFQAIKHIHTGDGGALVCRELRDHARARSLRWFGIDRENRQVNQYGIAAWDVVEAGYKKHMNDIAATIGLNLLPSLPEIIAARRANTANFNLAFDGMKRVRTLANNVTNTAAWLYTLLVDDQIGFIRFMRERGVETSIVHARNDVAPVFLHAAQPPSIMVAETFAAPEPDSIKPGRLTYVSDYQSAHKSVWTVPPPPLPGVDDFAARMVCLPVGPWVGAAERQQIIAAVQAWEAAK